MLEVLNTSIVVTATAHNPSLVHPSFLTALRIVPENWELSEGPVSTPAFSVVRYSNGVAISVDQQKFQVVDNEARDPRESELANIAERYVRTLVHIPYTGVGINIAGFLDMPEAEADAVTRRFLASGPWNAEQASLKSVGVRFVYEVLGARYRLAVDSGNIQRTDPSPRSRRGVVLAGNYHYEMSSDRDPRWQQVATIVRRFPDCYAHFHESVASIVDLRGEHATR